MTIFLVFFMILYVFSGIDAEQFEQVISTLQSEMGGEAKSERLKNIQQRKREEELAQVLNAFIDESGIKQFANVTVERDDIKIVFAEPVVFDSGRAELKPDVIPILEKLTDIIKKVPNNVVVEGHTDNVPLTPSSPFSSNWELSIQRAFSVVHYFTRIEGVSGSRFMPVGHGEYRPVAPNNTPENRAKNRRIEIRIRRTSAGTKKESRGL